MLVKHPHLSKNFYFVENSPTPIEKIETKDCISAIDSVNPGSKWKRIAKFNSHIENETIRIFENKDPFNEPNSFAVVIETSSEDGNRISSVLFLSDFAAENYPKDTEKTYHQIYDKNHDTTNKVLKALGHDPLEEKKASPNAPTAKEIIEEYYKFNKVKEHLDDEWLEKTLKESKNEEWILSFDMTDYFASEEELEPSFSFMATYYSKKWDNMSDQHHSEFDYFIANLLEKNGIKTTQFHDYKDLEKSGVMYVDIGIREGAHSIENIEDYDEFYIFYNKIWKIFTDAGLLELKYDDDDEYSDDRDIRYISPHENNGHITQFDIVEEGNKLKIVESRKRIELPLKEVIDMCYDSVITKGSLSVNWKDEIIKNAGGGDFDLVINYDTSGYSPEETKDMMEKNKVISNHFSGK